MPPARPSAGVVASAQGPRHAARLLCSPDQGEPHADDGILGAHARMHRLAHLTPLKHACGRRGWRLSRGILTRPSSMMGVMTPQCSQTSPHVTRHRLVGSQRAW
jgi:hypothetical protein